MDKKYIIVFVIILATLMICSLLSSSLSTLGGTSFFFITQQQQQSSGTTNGGTTNGGNNNGGNNNGGNNNGGNNNGGNNQEEEEEEEEQNNVIPYCQDAFVDLTDTDKYLYGMAMTGDGYDSGFSQLEAKNICANWGGDLPTNDNLNKLYSDLILEYTTALIQKGKKKAKEEVKFPSYCVYSWTGDGSALLSDGSNEKDCGKLGPNTSGKMPTDSGLGAALCIGKNFPSCSSITPLYNYTKKKTV